VLDGEVVGVHNYLRTQKILAKLLNDNHMANICFSIVVYLSFIKHLACIIYKLLLIPSLPQPCSNTETAWIAHQFKR